ncbi:hypothetical protein CY34DRAFT_798600 [Suillus luteus UH-Slu-Lm8-n1]|uniref:Unplaced genomic scaffold CY34scaffold_9, whole genome shotgun sequence n=1 Tax=Suillus luteus UH-Slu-Lm8-n1 TaxID=930992 RepID=A0A0D0BZM4_9AGAM|nr:hypothetical protein CY34DRAFT_798600 [Suillus luteus UH-Slu-Lm8-n1]
MHLDKFPGGSGWFLLAIRARTLFCAIERAFIRSQSGNYRQLSIFFDISDRCLLLVSYTISSRFQPAPPYSTPKYLRASVLNYPLLKKNLLTFEIQLQW